MSTGIPFISVPGVIPLKPGVPYPKIVCCIHIARDTRRELSTKLSARSNSPVIDFLRQLCVSSVLLGLGLNCHWALSLPASAHTPPPSSGLYHQEINENHDVAELENLEIIQDEELKAQFDRSKSRTYALTIPMRIVALNGSLPVVWIKQFLKSQGRRVKFRPEFRQSLGNIFHELSESYKKGIINSKSAASADVVTLGDSWLNFSISKGLIEPLKEAEYHDWFRDLSEKWKVYLRRNNEGNLNSQGKVWAVPYRWGSTVIAYNKKEFLKRKLPPIQDWSDLWRLELAGKISMVDSPREIIGAVLKSMGASYNTTNIDSQVVGGKYAVLQQLELLIQQVRLFDSQHYIKAYGTGDVWVVVGWSSDVVAAAKLMSNIAVIVPKSGASLWADFWAVPNTSRLVTDKIGGRVRGPSPLVRQWVEFCLQSERALPFKENIIAGASPISLKPTAQNPLERTNGRPKLDTNLIDNVPPADILHQCEFLEPLSDQAKSDYQWLLSNVYKPKYDDFVPHFWSKMKSKVVV